MSKIHKFEIDGLKIMLDVNSGSIHVIDQLTWDFIDYYQETGSLGKAQERLVAASSCSAIDGEGVADEVRQLIEEGTLFSGDESGSEYVVPQDPIVKALCLHISHDCNLRCSYCFAGSGHFGGQREHMSLEVGKKAIDLLLATSGPRQNCEVDFFGGEPLMNFDVVQELVAYGKEQARQLDKNIKFTLTTNGVLLNDKVEQFLNENQMSVVLSLDGRPEVNDQMRPTVSGRGSYDIILKNYRRFCSSRNGENYYLRGTYTSKNLDFSKDVLHMADEGFTSLSVEPVVAPPEEDYALKQEHMPKLREEYIKLAQEFYKRKEEGREINFFHFNLDLNRGPCLPKRLSGCGAGHEYLAVTPTGDLYPCHQFVGREEYKLGTVSDGVTKKDLVKKFQNAHIYNKEECTECWARFYCSGGCHANSLGDTGDIYKPYKVGCELAKMRIECAVYLQVKSALEG
ncbi:uncharacterized protein GGQ84_000122 [Desulfitispora alkaliphila]|uniref:thioether cross-link-forming SCIFF peptide maturase n=1 Tax=Desulfitispora alkaliphila TaxID=622674 RepID=UPI003D219189